MVIEDETKYDSLSKTKHSITHVLFINIFYFIICKITTIHRGKNSSYETIYN